MSTGVKYGSAYLMVVGTGYQTFVGRTASMIEDPMPDRQSPREVASPRHGVEYHGVLRSVGCTVCALSFVPIALTWFFGSFAGCSHQILELAVGLAIVAVPASLDTLFSTLRSRGVSHFSDEGGLAHRQIIDLESLAGIDTLCCDKTGTITENRLSMLAPYCIPCEPEDLILTANLSSSPDKGNLDPIEKAFATALENTHKPRPTRIDTRFLNISLSISMPKGDSPWSSHLTVSDCFV